MSEIINNAIVHYRDDLDLQNLIDFGQKKVPAKCGVTTQCPGGGVKMSLQKMPLSLGLWISFCYATVLMLLGIVLIINRSTLQSNYIITNSYFKFF